MEDQVSQRYPASVFLDACFLIDAASDEGEVFRDYLDQLKAEKVILYTIGMVRTEFVRAKSRERMEKKAAYFDSLKSAILPIDHEVEMIVASLLGEYGEDIEGVSVVDLYLAACVKRYRGLSLLTANHKDFPTNIFTRTQLVNFELRKAVRTYAYYQHQPKEKKIEVDKPPF